METAARVGGQALALVAGDSEAGYLENLERQWAIERLLIKFGEALKDVSAETLACIDPVANWAGPKGFRDIAAHWYEDGLDHELIWRALQSELPAMTTAIRAWLETGNSPSDPSA